MCLVVRVPEHIRTQQTYTHVLCVYMKGYDGLPQSFRHLHLIYEIRKFIVGGALLSSRVFLLERAIFLIPVLPSWKSRRRRPRVRAALAPRLGCRRLLEYWRHGDICRCICVCKCVCVRDVRGRESAREREREKKTVT